MDKKLRIAVIKTDGIGDAVLASPFFLGLRKHFKDAHITAYLSHGGAQVLDGLGCFDDVRVFDAQWLKYDPKPFFVRWFSAFSLINLLNKGKYDMIIGMRWQDRLTSFIVSMAEAKEKYGYDTGGMGFNINNIVKYPPISSHTAEKNMLMLRAITGEKLPAKPLLKTDKKSEDDVKALLEKGKVTKYIVMHPISGHPSKDWDIERYNSLAEYLSRGIKTVVIGAKTDRGVEKIRGRHVINLAGMLTIKEIKALIKKAALVIGNDSAGVHIASALGVRSLTIFSGTARHQEWGAYGDKSYIIDKYASCSPCSMADCDKKENNKECLDVPPDFVARLALDIIAGKQKQRLIKYKKQAA
jgi:ADP-heptose:LPS heptosyltransferase